jgi:peptidoglycan biosynthesis protein MviN/MurJ (putative lipid II flippase)
MPTNLPDRRQTSPRAAPGFDLDLAIRMLLGGIAAIYFSLSVLMRLHLVFDGNDNVEEFKVRQIIAPAVDRSILS